MHNISIFLLVFTILVSIRGLNKVISTLLQKEPQPVNFSNRELIYLGLSISYVITYILSK
jgi:hypothetical protein